MARQVHYRQAARRRAPFDRAEAERLKGVGRVAGAKADISTDISTDISMEDGAARRRHLEVVP